MTNTLSLVVWNSKGMLLIGHFCVTANTYCVVLVYIVSQCYVTLQVAPAWCFNLLIPIICLCVLANSIFYTLDMCCYAFISEVRSNFASFSSSCKRLGQLLSPSTFNLLIYIIECHLIT